jgi:hypothetical protein
VSSVISGGLLENGVGVYRFGLLFVFRSHFHSRRTGGDYNYSIIVIVSNCAQLIIIIIAG